MFTGSSVDNHRPKCGFDSCSDQQKKMQGTIFIYLFL